MLGGGLGSPHKSPSPQWEEPGVNVRGTQILAAAANVCSFVLLFRL